jgi:hypothetical protein
MIRRRPAQGVTVSNRSSRPLYRTVNRNKTINDNKAIGGQQRSIVGALLVFVSQTVVMTGLLYYFGWVRTQADFGYFGVDPSLLGYATSDYLIRSVGSSFPLLTGLALVAFALLGIHQLVLAHAVSAPVDTPAGKTLSVCVSTAPGLSFILAAGVLLRLFFPYQIVWPRGLALPLMLVSAVGVLGYSGHLRSLRRDALDKKQKEHPPSAEARIRAILLVALGMLGVLWWITLYAAQDGEQIAVDNVANLRDEPEIFIYSSDRIAIAGPGITVDPIREVGSKYRYRYSGLCLLVQAGGKYILVPVGWQKSRDSVFLVPVDGTIRLDVID